MLHTYILYRWRQATPLEEIHRSWVSRLPSFFLLWSVGWLTVLPASHCHSVKHTQSNKYSQLNSTDVYCCCCCSFRLLLLLLSAVTACLVVGAQAPWTRLDPEPASLRAVQGPRWRRGGGAGQAPGEAGAAQGPQSGVGGLGGSSGGQVAVAMAAMGGQFRSWQQQQ